MNTISKRGDQSKSRAKDCLKRGFSGQIARASQITTLPLTCFKSLSEFGSTKVNRASASHPDGQDARLFRNCVGGHRLHVWECWRRGLEVNPVSFGESRRRRTRFCSLQQSR